MSRRPLNLTMSVRDFPGQRGITINPGSREVDAWCLELVLLERGLIDATRVTAQDGSFSLVIKVAESIGDAEIGRVVWDNPSVAEVRLSRTEIERWVYFYLKFYRDQYGEVDHIDADLEGSGGSTGVFLVLKVPQASPPRRAGPELRRRLGLPGEP